MKLICWHALFDITIKVSDVQLAINEYIHPKLSNVAIKIFVFMLMCKNLCNITKT